MFTCTASSPSIIGDYCVFNWTEIMLSIFYKSQLLFCEKPFNSNKKYSESDIFKNFNFLIDNIFVVFDSCVFQQRVSIPIGTNCAPILADLFLQYLYETDFIQGSLQRKEKKLDQSFTNSFCCIDNVF
jgi:hypothetical protein